MYDIIDYRRCRKCGGAGIILSYDHIDNGRCWDCHGTGKVRVYGRKMGYAERAATEYKEREILLEQGYEESKKYVDENGEFDPYAALMAQI